MINEIEKYELIEKYLLNRVSEEEKQQVDNLLHNDPEFKKEFELHKEIQNTIIDYNLLELKTQLKKIHLKNNKLRNLNGKNLLLIISGIIILSTIIYFIVKRNDRPPSPDPEANASGSLIDYDTVSNINTNKEIISKNINDNNSSNHIIFTNKSSNKELNNIDSVKNYSIPKQEEKQLKKDENIYSDTLRKIKEYDESTSIQKTSIIICKLEASYRTTPSCNTHPSGKIELLEESINGGTPPYSLFINEKKYNRIIDNLSPGTYKVKLIDNNNCILEKEIIIGVENCFNEFVFSPSHNEIWEIPVKHNKKGIIKIYDKFGKQVYQKNLLSDYETWDGNDINNNPLPSGLYPFIIYYEDGEVFKGSVTLVR